MPKVVIVGAGFSGICMAYYLKKLNIDDFIVIEKGGAIGGTWYDNKYPGAECDVESHLYSFSFYPKPDWSRIFSGSNEIQEYIADCARSCKVYDHIVFNETVEKSDFENGMWTIKTNKNTYSCKYFLPSCSPLHCPLYPNIPDFNKFEGKVMHTAQWDHSYDFRDKTVAIIGNAASGTQCIPEIAESVKHLYVYQRTPNWILPKFNRTFYGFEKWIFKYVPFVQSGYRNLLYYYHEIFFVCFAKNHWFGRLSRWMSECYVAWQVRDKSLVEKLTPKFTFGCKRILFSDTYFPCFNRPNVTLVTDKIASLTKDSVVTAGADGTSSTKVDAVICATGFDVFAPIQSMHINKLQGSKAYLGIYAKDAPNLFLLLGPNTGSAHTGIPLYVEPQTEHIAKMIQYMETSGKKTIVVKPEVFDRFNSDLSRELGKYVWDQCDNWYRQSGSNDTLYPGSLMKYVREVKDISKDDFLFE